MSNDYRLAEHLQQEIKSMTGRQRAEFKRVLEQSLPSYITQAALVARNRSQNVTETKTKTTQGD